jgi:hypothetical protein
VLSSREMVNYILNLKETVYFPVLNYYDFLKQHLDKGNTQSMVDSFLDELNIEVISLDKEQAQLLAKASISKPQMDISDHGLLITAQVLGGVVVTKDKETFADYDVKSPEEVMV